MFVLLAAAGFAQAPAKSAEAPIDRNAFTFTDYRLHVTLHPDRSLINVRGSVILLNESPSAKSQAALQISSSLRWASITIDGEPVKFATRRIATDLDHTGAVNDALVPLRHAVAAGESVRIEFGYQGAIQLDTSRLQRIGTPATIAARSDWDRISTAWTGVRGLGQVIWYPVALEPAFLDKGAEVFARIADHKARHEESAFRASFEVPADMTLLVNGERAQSAAQASGFDPAQSLRMYFPRMGYETPTFVLADYQMRDTANGKIYFLKGSEDAARNYGAALAKLMPIAANRANTGVTVAQMPTGQVPFESGPFFLSPLASTATEPEIQLALVHTFTHAIFYSPRAWIQEGVAHLAQAMMIEKQKGREAAVQFLDQRRSSLALAETETGTGSAANSLLRTADEIFYRSKSLFVWWMLRDMVGDEVLTRSLSAYDGSRDRDPATMQRLLEDGSKRNLEFIFQDWVYRDRGLPDFSVSAVYPRQNLKGGYLVTITIENKGAAAAEVPIRIKTREHHTTIKLEVLGNEKASARVNLNTAPIEVTVNDGSVPESDPSNNRFVVPAPK